MSSGLMSAIPSVPVLPPFMPSLMLPELALCIGIPSITISTGSYPFMEAGPRMAILDALPSPAAFGLMMSPATLPERELMKFASLTVVTRSVSTFCMVHPAFPTESAWWISRACMPDEINNAEIRQQSVFTRFFMVLTCFMRTSISVSGRR